MGITDTEACDVEMKTYEEATDVQITSLYPYSRK